MYRDLSINASYLTRIADQFTVVFASVNNVLGLNQVLAEPIPQKTRCVCGSETTTGDQHFLGMFINISSHTGTIIAVSTRQIKPYETEYPLISADRFSNPVCTKP